jgi:hypothetical protein
MFVDGATDDAQVVPPARALTREQTVLDPLRERLVADAVQVADQLSRNAADAVQRHEFACLFQVSSYFCTDP